MSYPGSDPTTTRHDDLPALLPCEGWQDGVSRASEVEELRRQVELMEADMLQRAKSEERMRTINEQLKQVRSPPFPRPLSLPSASLSPFLPPLRSRQPAMPLPPLLSPLPPRCTLGSGIGWEGGSIRCFAWHGGCAGTQRAADLCVGGGGE